MQLYTYYRSQASFRVRIALNLKGLGRDDVFLHLEKGDQFAAEYRALNPQMVVPTLLDGEVKLFQSLAILEYLEEKHPQPPLLPSDIAARAWVRGFALINVADTHPLVVPRVRHYLLDELHLTQDQLLAWIRHWFGAGLDGDGSAARRTPRKRRFLPRRRTDDRRHLPGPAGLVGQELRHRPGALPAGHAHPRPCHGDPGLCRRPSGEAARRGIAG